MSRGGVMFGDGYEFLGEEGPEAAFARQEHEAAERRRIADERIIHDLLGSLTPFDAARICFSWRDIQRFRLRRKH